MGMKNYLVAGFVLGLALALPAVSFAASINAGQVISVAGTKPAVGNAYAVGGTVTATSEISGDLAAAGGTVLASGKINGDLLVAGGTINIFGVSAEDGRVAGGNLTIGGNFSGELLVGGGQIVVTPDTSIAKDSYLAGGSIAFSGKEAGNLELNGGAIYFDGTVNGNLLIRSSDKVTIGPHAVIKGSLEYTAPAAATIESGAKITGTPVFHQKEARAGARQSRPAMLGVFTAWWFIKLLMSLTAAYLLWYIFRRDSVSILEDAFVRYGKSLLRGFAFMVLMPIAAIIACFTVIGIIPGMIAFFAYVAVLILASPLAVLFAASLLLRGKTDLLWYHILLAAVVLALVRLIPFVGWIIGALIYLGALGALTAALRGKFAR